MPYLPPSVIEDTTFPSAGDNAAGPDLTTMAGLISEKWRRFFPVIDYYMLRWSPTTVNPLDDEVSGVPNETMVDDLWGEDIPTSLTAEWIQPHENTADGLAHDATDTRRYYDPIQVHASVQIDPTDRQLRKMGFDNMKDLIITIPTPVLDDRGITMRIGDYFYWRGEQYEVEEQRPKGYWKNTNIFLYVLGNCKRKRLGS